MGEESATAGAALRRPRRGGLVLTVLAVAAVAALGGRLGWRVWQESRERSRLRALIREENAAREAAIPRPEPVDAAQDSAATYAGAFVAVDRAAMNRLTVALAKSTYSATGERRRASRVLGGGRSPTAAKDLEANERAFDLFGRAAAFPANSLRDQRKWRWGEMAALFAARADARQLDGDPDGALRDCLQVHRAARQWRRPWPMRNTPDAWHARAVDVLARVVEDRRLGAPAAREALATLLTAEESRRIFDDRYALSRIDYAKFILMFLGDDPQSAIRARGMSRPSVFERVLTRLQGGTYGDSRPPTSVDVARALEAMRRFEGIRAMKGAARTAAAVEFNREMSALPQGDIAREAASYDHYQFAQGAEFEMFLGLVRTALAVRVREVEAGAPPATLEELVPGVLDGLPEDPFHGGPFGYEVRPEGWIVFTRGAPTGWPTMNFPKRIDSLPVPAAAPAEGK